MKNKFQLKGLIKPALIFFTLLVILLNYQLVYKNNLKEIKAVKTDISNLTKTLSELQAKQANRDTKVKENDTLTRQLSDKIMAFGNGTTEEKSILFITELEKYADMDIDTVTFSEPEYFLNGSEKSTVSDNSVAEEEIDGAAEEELTTNRQEDENVKEQIDGIGATKNIDMQKIKGYRSALIITFKVSYDGLKKCIDYINNYPEKRNIDEITLSYDSETGNLTGSMKINMYNLIGTGKEYSEPAVGNMGIGLDNLFGTIEFNPN